MQLLYLLMAVNLPFKLRKQPAVQFSQLLSDCFALYCQIYRILDRLAWHYCDDSRASVGEKPMLKVNQATVLARLFKGQKHNTHGCVGSFGLQWWRNPGSQYARAPTRAASKGTGSDGS